NEAFGLLEQYYREQGRLPLEPPRHTAPAAPQRPRPSETTVPPQRSRRQRRDPSSVPRLGPWIGAAALLGFGVYYLLDLVMSNGRQTIDVDHSRIELPVDPAQPPARSSKTATARKPPLVTFGYGDPPGRVLEVQGVPTRTA